LIYGKKMKNPEGVKKVSIIILASILGVFTALYLAFLFVVPAVVKIENFVPMIETELNKVVKFKFELVEPKLKTTWRLGIKVQAKKLALKYDDNRDVVNLTEPSIEINLPTLVFKRLNLDKIYAKDISGLIVFDKNKKYTFENYLIEQEKAADSEVKDEAPQELPVDIRNINLIVDNATLTFIDENISKTYAFNARDTKVFINSLKGPLKLQTKGDLKLLGDKGKSFIDFDINLSTVFPKDTGEQKPAPEEKAEEKFAALNPFENLDVFGAYSKVFVDLKVNNLENFNASGVIKVSDTTIMKLPKSHAELTFKGDTINVDSNLYIAANEFLNANGSIKVGKKAKIDMQAKSEKISLENVKSLSGFVLDVLNIKNDVKDIKTTGYFTCDFDVKSDLKTLQSKGYLALKEGSVDYPHLGLNLTQMGAMLDFSNNKLTIKDTSALVNGSKFSVSGEILSNSKLTMNINSDPIKIPDLVNLGLQFKVIRPQDVADFVFSSGTMVLKAALKGSLTNISPTADVEIKGLGMKIKSLGLPLNIEKIAIAVKPDKKNDFIMDIVATNTVGSMEFPKINIKVPLVKIAGDSKVLNVLPTDAWIDSSKLNASGRIDNYMLPSISFNFSGTGIVHPSTILAQLPPANRKLVKSAGTMPIEGTFGGDFTNMKFVSKVTSNPSNYVSIVDIESMKGQTNTLNIDLNIKGTNLILNDISINSPRAKIASVKGSLGRIDTVNPTISNLSVVLPQKLVVSAPALGISRVGVNADISVSGSALSPSITGSANITDLSYPDFGLTMGGANIDFKKSLINASATGIKVANSDFSGDMQMSSDFSKGVIINHLNFNSNYMDSDELMKLAASAPNTVSTPGPSTQGASGTGGLVIKTGKGSISKIKSGTLFAENVSFNYNMYNDLFKMSNLVANAYDGSVKGDVSYHLAYLRANVDVAASGINMGKFANDMTGLIIPVTGTLDGLLKVSLSGATMEQQMRTLNGDAKFTIKNGELKDFIRLENFLYAGNIATQNLLGFNLNSVISAVSRDNTGEFRNLDGVLTFGNGWANVQNIKTQGPNMSMFVTGKYNLMTNSMDLKVLGRISPKIVKVLGPLGSFSANSLLEKLPPTGLAILDVVKAVSPQNPLLAEISQTDIAKIPELSPKSEGETREFQVLLNGPAASTKSVKSFKWAAKPGETSTPASTSGTTSSTVSTPSTGAAKTTTQAIPTSTGTGTSSSGSGTSTSIPVSIPISIPTKSGESIQLNIPIKRN